MLPQQQILQANGKASIDMIRLAPNSSVLIADTTEPIVWKCVSDSLGNVTSEAFDISPHKVVEKESLEKRIERIEEILNESIITTKRETDIQSYESIEKPPVVVAEQSAI
jgi:hypothetical protein